MKFLLLKQLIVLTVTGMSITLGFSQEITQNIRGIVRDEASGMPLPGATVVIADSDPVIGEITSYDGSFKLKNIPIGRVDLMISFIGYEPKVVPNVRIGAAKEIVLGINLQESLVKMREDDLPVVIDKISDSWNDEKDGKVWEYGELIQYAQEKFVREDENAAIVRSNRYYNYSDPWHYDSEGYIDLGKQCAEEFIQLNSK
ncbi:MAG TPA: hypothetical protein DDY13_06065 [Cytophagales bacterium]|jgi:hypothetical protein|nr:hypothetical protein [Cytophagales bacterium]